MITNRSDRCLKCEPCAVMYGLAGAGAFSDGKFIITTEYGGWINDIIDSDEAISYMKDADDISKISEKTSIFDPYFGVIHR